MMRNPRVKYDRRSRKLVIELDLIDDPTTTNSGKNLLVASTFGGMDTCVKIGGRFVTVSASAWIPKQ